MADAVRRKMLLVINPVSGKKLAKQYMMRMVNRFDQAGLQRNRLLHAD